jgi:MSHA biogenesis protein MshO
MIIHRSKDSGFHLISITQQRGFTFFEMIAVMVILGIIGSIGSSFVVTSMNAYRTAEMHQRLKQRVGLTAEQMSRELRMAAPNTIRLSPSGNCIEFMPIVAAALYLNLLPTPENGQPQTNTIATSQFTLGLGTAKYAVVAPYFPSEVYTSALPSAIKAMAALAAPPYTAVPLASNHQFLRNSPTQRVYVVDDPVRFCVTNDTLVRYSDYGLLTGALSDADPGGTEALMSHEVDVIGSAFSLSPGSEENNVKVLINLSFRRDGQSLDLIHQVGVKNVP